jgi:hypothetical protein
VTWLEEHWQDILGWGGSALLVFSLLQSRVLRFRVLNLAASALLLIFNVLIQVWPMAALNLALCLINVWFIVRLLSQRHDAAVFEVLEVDPSDAYLHYLLRVHGADILQSQPDFSWDPGLPDQHAFVVQRGDESVGLVLLHADGPVARILLDYVTERFRDFSPGEFVWRRSGLLRERGFTRVVSPSGMVRPYYDRVGFRPESGAYVLDL